MARARPKFPLMLAGRAWRPAGIVHGLAILLLAASSLAACAARRSAPEDQRTTIVFNHGKHPRSEYLTELIGRFEKEHPHIRVREQILPSNSDEQHQFYVINLAAGSRDVDVLDMDIIWVPEFARAGWLQDLSASLRDAELAPLNAAALEADRLEGRLYAVPWFLDAGVLYYRQDLLDKYGLPTPRTYAELVAAARTILAGEQDPGLAGFIWQGKQYEGLVCVALEFIRGNGGSVLDGGQQIALTAPPVLEALRFMGDLHWVYGVTPPSVTTMNEEPTRQVFQSGKAIFMRNWPYAWPILNQPGSPVRGRVGMTAVPHFAGHQSAPTLGGFHLGMNAYSQHKQEAMAFVRFMIRHQSQRDILVHLGVLPAHMQLYEDPEMMARFPLLAELGVSLRQARARPATPYYPMISHILQPELSAIVTGIRGPREAMSRAESEINHLLGGP